MPQQLAHLRQRRPGPQHRGGQRVTQLVRTDPGQPGPLTGAAHDMADLSVVNTDRVSHSGRPSVSHATIASPGSTGSGRRSTRLPLPTTVSSPDRQSMSSRRRLATSPRRSPSRASTSKIA